MGFLRKLFGGTRSAPPLRIAPGRGCTFNIEGEAAYQAALDQRAAAVTLGGADRERFWRAIEDPSGPPLRVCARYLKGSDKLRHATRVKLL